MNHRRALPFFPILLAALVSGLLSAVGSVPARAQAPVDDRGRGLVYDGMHRSSRDSVCGGAFELDHRDGGSRRDQSVLCTHGPDPAPPGVDVRQRRDPVPGATGDTLPTGGVASAQAGIPCYGTGVDGYRVQTIYARASDVADRFGAYSGSFVQWAAAMDSVFDSSAAETGGSRHVRFVTDTSCNLVIDRVTLSSTGDDSLNNTISELRSRGYTRTDRKYLVWVDSNVYCGIGQIYNDDRPSATPGANYNNGSTMVQGEVARVDNRCWGQSQSVEAHELMHNLGGVQPTAPNATPGYHCTDDADRMCYADGSGGGALRTVCSSIEENRFDCRHDDYFSTAPVAGSWLASHWNSADSAFLASSASPPPPTTTTTSTTSTTKPPTTTSTTRPPTTTTTAPSTTTTRPPTTTTSVPTTQPAPTTTKPPTTTTAAPTTTTTPPATGVPSAPRSLFATQPAIGSGVRLFWQAPATGPVVGYRVYRGLAITQLFLAAVGNVGTFTDTNTISGVLYYYRVTAYNSAGESVSSAVVGMTAR